MATAVIISTEVMAADDTQVTQNDVATLIEKATDGYRVGSFWVKPEASVSGVYDSNVFATRKNEAEDEILLISPNLHVGSMWDKHKLDLNMGGDFGGYQSYNSENYDDYWLNADGRYDLSTKTNVFGGIRFSQEHEDRSSPDYIQSGSGPVVIDSNRAHAGVSHESASGGGKAVESKIFKGRRPVWAQEGIPEVELGRLNVSRAPSRVLARAENEALATYLSEMSVLYNLSADDAANLLESNFRGVSRYDSPVQNLALYKDVMIFGKTELNDIDPNLTPSSQLDLAAIFLGSASDKTMPISENTVIALNRILGLVELSSEERNILATKAETVRQSILIGHGPTDEH